MSKLIFLSRYYLRNKYPYSTISIKIGNVSSTVTKAIHKELVPVNYLKGDDDKKFLRHLQWMLKKDNLGQDIFLVGFPGSYRRRLAMAFGEVTDREVEYVSLSRDTTEADLKQRREMVNGSAVYVDQSALRAALNGRLLILEGVEKAERNVLPILNNLLENREMQLEDGRFLMRASIYDSLKAKYSQSELNKWRLIRCNEQFRVVALGLPVPRFPGHPLDPPLRSRFQARFLVGESYDQLLNAITQICPSSLRDRLTKLISFMYALRSEHLNELPLFPVDSAFASLSLLAHVPNITDLQIIHSLYPYSELCNDQSVKLIEQLMEKFNISKSQSNSTITFTSASPNAVNLQCSKSRKNISVPLTTGDALNAVIPSFVRTPSIDGILADLSLSHAVGDFCLIGSQGCGKTMIVEALAGLLGARVTHVVLYGDMTSREMLQQRETDPVTGNTIWRHSALIRAALDGEWAVLGGLHRLEKGCLAVLSQIVSDRQLQLFDGSRLLREDRYELIKSQLGCDDSQMAERGIFKIHPKFRIIALADPPSIPGESTKSHSLTRVDWFTAEVLSNFRFHILPELSKEDQRKIIEDLVPQCPKHKISQLLEITQLFRNSTDTQMKDLSHNMSIRQILRIARRLAQYPNETIPNAVHRACLSKFLPKHIQEPLNELLEPFIPDNSVNQNNAQVHSELLQKLLDDYHNANRSTEVTSLKGEDEAKVPNILFYDSVAHTKILLEMMEDFLLSEKQHLLLIGNQGVGKNKIVDRFLQLLNRPREYIQLHRDTTVQTLTMQPSIRDGRLVYEDSALVKAVTKGMVLVVDEADKASTQVTCILKTLLTVGDMDLSDGRRIVPEHLDVSSWSTAQRDKLIRIHPQFRMIVLANRPGFPFLGNDFFGAMGDVFSCHAVDNPDVSSEIEMLHKYGPQVPLDTVKKLVYLFNDLRDMADQGHIQYPYSTREIVNIVRHLQTFPNDSLSTVLSNVFDFDLSNKDMMSTLDSTLEKHGISLPGMEVRISLAKELPLPALQQVSSWRFSTLPSSLKSASYKGTSKNLYEIKPVNQKLETEMTRSKGFTELEEFVSLKFGEYNIVSDMVTSNKGHRQSYIHIATMNPIKLYTISLAKDNDGNYCKLSSCKYNTQIDLSDMFPPVQGSFRPHVSIAPLPPPQDSSVLLHEATTNIILKIDTDTGSVMRLYSNDCVPESKVKLRPKWYNSESDIKNPRQMLSMHRNWSLDPLESFVVFHKPGDDFLSVFHCLDNEWHKVYVDVPLKSVHLVDKNNWLVQDMDNLCYIVSRRSFTDCKFTLQRIYEEQQSMVLEHMFNDRVDRCNLHPDLGLDHSSSSDMILGTGTDSYVTLMPSTMITAREANSVHVIPRPSPLAVSPSFHNAKCATLPSSGIIVNSVDKATVPRQCLGNQLVSATSVSGYLEVVNLRSRILKYLRIPSAFEEAVTYKWLSSNVPQVFVRRLGTDIITLDSTGCVHKWTLCPVKLNSELNAWKMGIGAGQEEDDRNLMIERKEEDVITTLDTPKHGKVDPTGAPHVGGNTWAGGTGGRDTAGLGGIGGPYRLDGGNDVYQVPDSIKNSVPESVLKAAREVAEKAWRDRLRQIQMSEFDYDLYMKYYKRVQSQINVIKVMIDTLQATAKERQWLRHRTHGDLDDGKLVEGVLGERTIYRARGEKEPEPGSPQQKPKRLRIVADVSGSMYRFNGQDQRMERQLEALLMLMESFSTIRKLKMIYDICGHSGEGSQFPFVNLNEPPTNEKHRMKVLLEILAHSQFCVSGDHTLEAIDAGIKELKKTHDSMDQSFLIILSDANLSRYGIRPSSVAKLLLRDKDIHSYIVFIGSLGEQAQLLKKALPPGRSFVCMDNGQLPDILRNIFTATVLS